MRKFLLGGDHTLALKTDGTLMSWGYNNIFGVVGDGTTELYRSSPVQIGTGFIHISAGPYHSLALKADGSVWAWGANWQGRLGNNSTTNSLVPIQVGTGFAAVEAGDSSSYALKADGSLWAWGHNASGQLGNGSTTDSLVPIDVNSDFVYISADTHCLAIKDDGSLWAWGDNGFGQIGNNTTENVLSPVQIGTGYARASAGQGHSLAINTSGAVYAWGDNGFGQLGDGTTTERHTPTLAGTGYSDVVAGQYHSAGLTTSGTLKLWGSNSSGQLGNGTTSDEATSTPTQESSNANSWEITATPDYDSLDDDWEITYFGNTSSYGPNDDPDNDGLTNSQEYTAGTNPTRADSDSDGMPDKWEVDNGTAPTSSDAGADLDSDGVSNIAEYIAGTDPNDITSYPKPKLNDRYTTLFLTNEANTQIAALNLRDGKVIDMEQGSGYVFSVESKSSSWDLIDWQFTNAHRGMLSYYRSTLSGVLTWVAFDDSYKMLNTNEGSDWGTIEGVLVPSDTWTYGCSVNLSSRKVLFWHNNITGQVKSTILDSTGKAIAGTITYTTSATDLKIVAAVESGNHVFLYLQSTIDKRMLLWRLDNQTLQQVDTVEGSGWDYVSDLNMQDDPKLYVDNDSGHFAFISVDLTSGLARFAKLNATSGVMNGSVQGADWDFITSQTLSSTWRISHVGTVNRKPTIFWYKNPSTLQQAYWTLSDSLYFTQWDYVHDLALGAWRPVFMTPTLKPILLPTTTPVNMLLLGAGN